MIATVASTLEPTLNLITNKAEEEGVELELSSHVCEGGLELYQAGEIEKHNQLIAEAAARLAKDHDAIVFAQASMAAAVPTVEQQVNVPVLSSPILAVRRIGETLGLNT